MIARDWNGRGISVWNVKDVNNGVEDLKNGMTSSILCIKAILY